LCGISALKRPVRSYRDHVTTESGVDLPEENFPYEIGWIFVMPSLRGRRLSLDLTRAALDGTGDAGLFATSRTDNTAMQAMLKKCGFVHAGKSWKSSRGNYDLQLFVKQPK
jgi:RimJ/RimL family protein N-acetyltransferase